MVFFSFRLRLVCLASLAGLSLLLSACQSAASPPAEEDGFTVRRALLLDQVADHYKPTDYHDRGKYSFPVVVARMEKYGTEDQRASGYIEEYASDKYGFFHFPFVGLARILGRFPEAGAVVRNREDFLRRILFHDPGFHYNALTGEGTENHVAMSRTSGYLFAEEAMIYPDLAPRAAEWKTELKPWLLDWSRRIYRYGTGEWDSGIYTAYNLIGWLNLHDFAKDPEIRAAARAVLDYYAANIALKYTQGIYSGPESRGATVYGPDPRSATEYLGWLWFGPDAPETGKDFFARSEYIQAVHAATSAYRPPPALRALGRKAVPTPANYRLAKPDYLLTVKGESQEAYVIEKSFTVGTVQTPYGGWSNASYGVVNWKAVLMDPASEPAIVWGNGGMKSTSHGRGRNPFDQFLQYGSTVVQMTRVPEDAPVLAEQMAGKVREWQAAHARDFNKRWGRRHHQHPGPVDDSARGSLGNAGQSLVFVPADARLVSAGKVVYLQRGPTLAVIRSLGESSPSTEEGKLMDTAPAGGIAGFVIEFANAADHGDLAAFTGACAKRTKLEKDPGDASKFHYTTLAGDVITFRYDETGSWQEMQYDWGYGVTGRRVGFNSGEWKQPDWPKGSGQGRIPEVWINGQPLAALPPSTVIDGPQLRLEGARLQLMQSGQRVYEVDYSGPHPVFSTDPE